MAKQCDLLCPFVNRFIKMFTVKKENTVVKIFHLYIINHLLSESVQPNLNHEFMVAEIV